MVKTHVSWYKRKCLIDEPGSRLKGIHIRGMLFKCNINKEVMILETLHALYGDRLIKLEERLLKMCPTEVGEEYYNSCFRLYFNFKRDPSWMWLDLLEEQLNKVH